MPRQRKALEAVELIRATTERLIAKCKDMVDAEEQVAHLLRPFVPVNPGVDTKQNCHLIHSTILCAPVCCVIILGSVWPKQLHQQGLPASTLGLTMSQQ